MSNIFSYKAGGHAASIKDIDGKKGIVTGYFASFGNVDADGDIISKGAFTKTIMECGPMSAQPRIKHLLNHNTSQPLGVIKSLMEDDKGLAYESQIGGHSLGMDFIKMVDSGLITEHSIGFQIMKRNQIQSYEDYQKNPSAGWFDIKEVKLWEGSSLTAWGANQNTPLTGMKGTADLQDLVNRQKRLEKFCRNSDATDETIELLLIECKQLTQIILDRTTQPVVTTEPEPVIDDVGKYAKAITNFLKTNS
jgi:HK97 family phage prohead protease